MLDAALIQQCADPSLKPAIVAQFVIAAGANDPLAVTVTSGGRLILVPKATSPDEAMAIIRQYVGQAVVRVGLTQFPAGVGVKDAADLKPDLVDACENLRKGTSMFAKVLRIVAKSYGNPSDDVFPQVFEDAVYAWNTGEFDGVSVFQASDPGGDVTAASAPAENEDVADDEDQEDLQSERSEDNHNAGSAEMRIDLSRIGGK